MSLGSGPGEQMGAVGTLGHLHKTEAFVHLVSCKLAESSSIALSRTPQAAGEFGGGPLVLLDGHS